MSEGLAPFVEILRRGGVLACPTETLMGLLADATNAEAVERVAAIKGRADGSPMAILIPDVSALTRLAHPLEARAAALAAAHWPGPLTLLLRATASAHPLLVRDGKIGVRVPGPSPALELARAFGGPLTATSANRSGQPAALRASELPSALLSELDGVVPGEAPGGAPSTIVDATGYALLVLRAGAVAIDDSLGG